MQSSMPLIFKHRPTGLLGRYVESFWYRPAASAGAAKTGMLVLPAGRAEFVISLDGAAQTSWIDPDLGNRRNEMHCATVRKANCTPIAAMLSGRDAAFGVSFKPHGLHHFTRVPLGEAASVAALEEIWGPRVDEVVERLAHAPTPAAKFVLMETLLWSRLREPHGADRQVQRAVQLLSDPFMVRSVDSVAGEVGLSPRRLLDLFRHDVGLSPKAFARVMRFGAALRMVREKGPTRWADVAATCNYFDQAHLVREFHALAGMAPTAYLERRTTGHANCLPWDPQATRDPFGIVESERQPAFT